MSAQSRNIGYRGERMPKVVPTHIFSTIAFFALFFWKELGRTIDISACVPCTVFCAESNAVVSFGAQSPQLVKKQEQFRPLAESETQMVLAISIRFFVYTESPNTNTLLQHQGFNQSHGASKLWGAQGDCNCITTRILQTPKHTAGPHVWYSACFRAAVSQVAINTVQK